MGAAESSSSEPKQQTAWNPNGRIFLYVDNSNIYFSTQAHAGRVQRFPPGVTDITCRMHLHTLIEGVTKGRNVLVRNAYGLMTPEVAAMLQKEGINVSNSTRSGQTVREKDKEADAQLIADAVEDIVLHRPGKGKGNPNGDTIILFSGDQQVCPIIKKARKHGWNVEVWSYAESLSEIIKEEQKQATGLTTVTIMPLEDHFDKFTFFDNKDFTKELPPDRTLLLTFKDGVKFMQGLEAEKKTAIKETLILEAKKIFKLPLALQYQPSETNDLQCALIITLPEVDRATEKAYYNFETDVFQRRKTLVDAVENYLVRNFGGEKKLEASKFGKPNSNPATNPGKVVPKKTKGADGSSQQPQRGAASNYSGRKAEFCYSTLSGCTRPCKNVNSAKCWFAHSRDEIFCYKCGVKGHHATSKCTVQNDVNM